MKKSTKFSPEVRERAVRMVFEVHPEYSSQWAAIQTIAPRSAARSTSWSVNTVCTSASGSTCWIIVIHISHQAKIQYIAIIPIQLLDCLLP